MESWLVLKIQTPLPSTKDPRKTNKVFISVPKRLVAKAVDRNRIRRVLKEAIRLDGMFRENKHYFLRVIKRPLKVDLHQAKVALANLHA